MTRGGEKLSARPQLLIISSTRHPQVVLEAEALRRLMDAKFIVPKMLGASKKQKLLTLVKNLPRILIALARARIPPIPSRTFISTILMLGPLYEELRTNRYDIIYCHWLFPAGLLGILLSRMLRVRSYVVSSVWGYDVQVSRLNKRYGIHGVRRLISRYVLERSDLVVVNRRAHLEVVRSLAGPRNSRIIYLPPSLPDLSRTVPTTPKLHPQLKELLQRARNNHVVLYAPSLKPNYGILEFVKAASLLSKSHGNVIFAVVGEGELKSYAEKMARQKGIADRVYFLGRVGHDQMLQLYRVSTIVCDLSYFGSGTTTLEAFCFGKPVIGIYSHKTFIIHGHNGYLIRRGDHRALARYISMLLSDESLRKKLAVGARRTYEDNYSMEKRIKSLMEAFRTLLSRSCLSTHS